MTIAKRILKINKVFERVVDFNDYDDDYILLNGVVENKKLSLIIINDPIKSTHAKVINNTYYIKYQFICQ